MFGFASNTSTLAPAIEVNLAPAKAGAFFCLRETHCTHQTLRQTHSVLLELLSKTFPGDGERNQFPARVRVGVGTGKRHLRGCARLVSVVSRGVNAVT